MPSTEMKRRPSTNPAGLNVRTAQWSQNFTKAPSLAQVNAMSMHGIKVHVRTDVIGGLDYDGIASGMYLAGSEGDSPLVPSMAPRNMQ